MAYWLGQYDSAQMVDRIMLASLTSKSEAFDCSMIVPKCRPTTLSSRRTNPFVKTLVEDEHSPRHKTNSR